MQWSRVFTLSRAIDLFIYGGPDVGLIGGRIGFVFKALSIHITSFIES